MQDLYRKIFGVYVVTDGEISPGRTHVEMAEAAVAGGASCVQLREKKMPDREMLRVANKMRDVTWGTKTLFIVNNRLDIALACGADGLHVGQDDLPLGVVREIVGPDMIVGVSTGTVEEALRAEAEGADYVAIGPIYETATKSDAGAAVGLQAITDIRHAVGVPVVAIGGIGMGNIASVAAAGADSAVVVSAVVCASDMAGSARELAVEFERGRK